MIQIMFTIYDEKAKAYLPPFFLPSEGMATRTFGDCLNSNDHQFSKHPSDYTLFRLGTFDDNGAIMEYCKTVVGNGVEFLNQNKFDVPVNGAGEPDETTINNDAPILPGTESSDPT